MASPAAGPDPAPVPPAADPASIRASLTPTLLDVFDREWGIVLDRAKQTKELREIQALLQKWRHIAFAEMRDPGSYFRVQAKAERILRTGENPGALSLQEVQSLIKRRLEQ